MPRLSVVLTEGRGCTASLRHASLFPGETERASAATFQEHRLSGFEAEKLKVNPDKRHRVVQLCTPIFPQLKIKGCPVWAEEEIFPISTEESQSAKATRIKV
ncbi:hypothetical protein SKAU_G00206560 [Synaphobranchus kaupii]|uniref:Uncharacterized protein n=1 Tax=Synaphobranchus kaupii TaxID=118154 RepID=A0A9Q1IWL6_SYNKA|nr:hypothetical protein SKAU_G00206560 [Synaphobranchus kaupii]